MAATTGAVGELIDEFAVQYSKGLEAVREREASEQLRGEACACEPLPHALFRCTVGAWCTTEAHLPRDKSAVGPGSPVSVLRASAGLGR